MNNNNTPIFLAKPNYQAPMKTQLNCAIDKLRTGGNIACIIHLYSSGQQ